MKIKFNEQDIQSFRDIIQEYRDVSCELYAYQKKAEEIQTKVIELEETLKSIKEKEDTLMTELKGKYGEFGLQDIYECLYMDNMKK
jgi:uncharacterized protein YlxW (UPF0749 family)